MLRIISREISFIRIAAPLHEVLLLILMVIYGISEAAPVGTFFDEHFL